MKINAIVLFLFVFSLCACFDDKGNYDYREVAEITIENVPEVIEVLGNSDCRETESRFFFGRRDNGGQR